MKIFSGKKVTRGNGLLEYFLAIRRARLANSFIDELHRCGRILDIGCGSFPIFLLTSRFVEKYAIENNECLHPHLKKRLNFIIRDINQDARIILKDRFIDVATMLAVLEHIDKENAVNIFPEIYRVLKYGGICIITVPAPWTGWLLKCLSSLGLISKIELSEHRPNLSNSTIKSMIEKSGFKEIRSGYFELFMNRYFVARKL